MALSSLLSLAACSSAPPPSGASAPSIDDAAALDDASDGAATPATDAPGEATGHETGSPPGDVPAGKAGTDAFCTQLCAHEQRCAAGGDAAPPGLTDCDVNCQMANEAPTTNPPTELLRADYLDALASCIAGASCAEPLQTSEANCAERIAVGDADAGVQALAPTQAARSEEHTSELQSLRLSRMPSSA